METPIISIVMPTHKSATTVERAINSVIAQDFSLPFELVVSFEDRHDGTKEILDAYVEKYPDLIRVHNKIRATGAMGSRMEGIEVARGEFVYFMDSDDELQPFCLKKLYSAQQKWNADCVNASFCTSSDGKITHNGFVRGGVQNRRQVLNALLHDTYFRAFLWTKLFRRELLLAKPSIVLEDYKDIFEDTAFGFSALSKCKTVTSIKDEVYIYHKDNQASATSTPRCDRALYHIGSLACIRRFIEIYGSKQDLRDFRSHHARYYWNMVFDLMLDKKHGASKDYVKKTKRELKLIVKKGALELGGHFYDTLLERAFLK